MPAKLIDLPPEFRWHTAGSGLAIGHRLIRKRARGRPAGPRAGGARAGSPASGYELASLPFPFFVPYLEIERSCLVRASAGWMNRPWWRASSFRWMTTHFAAAGLAVPLMVCRLARRSRPCRRRRRHGTRSAHCCDIGLVALGSTRPRSSPEWPGCWSPGQMILDLIVLGVGAKVIVGAITRRRQQGPQDQ